MPRRRNRNQNNEDRDSDDETASNYSTSTRATSRATKSVKSSKKGSHLSDLNDITEENNNEIMVEDLLEQSLEYLDSSTSKKMKLGLEYLLQGLRNFSSAEGEYFVNRNSETICNMCFRVLQKSSKNVFSLRAVLGLGCLILYELNDEETIFSEILEKFQELVSEDETAVSNIHKRDEYTAAAVLLMGLMSTFSPPNDFNNLVKDMFQIAVKSGKRSTKITSNVNLKKAQEVTSSAMEAGNVNTASSSTLSESSQHAAHKCACSLDALSLIFSTLPNNSIRFRNFLQNSTNRTNLLNLLQHELSAEVRIAAGKLLAILIFRSKLNASRDYEHRIDDVDFSKDVLNLDSDEFINQIQEIIKDFTNSNDRRLDKEDNKSIKSIFKKIENGLGVGFLEGVMILKIFQRAG